MTVNRRKWQILGAPVAVWITIILALLSWVGLGATWKATADSQIRQNKELCAEVREQQKKDTDEINKNKLLFTSINTKLEGITTLVGDLNTKVEGLQNERRKTCP